MVVVGGYASLDVDGKLSKAGTGAYWKNEVCVFTVAEAVLRGIGDKEGETSK